MKMSEVVIGMRLRSNLPGALSPITVSEITERGFKYKIDAPKPFIPRWGMMFAAEDHEHYGYQGETFYEPYPYEMEAADAVIDKLCADPEVWLTHGMPGEVKVSRIRDAIAEAIRLARLPNSINK